MSPPTCMSRSLMMNRKSTTGFPTSYRWSAYVTPKSPKGRLKKRFFAFSLKTNQFQSNKVCYKVALCENVQRQSSSRPITILSSNGPSTMARNVTLQPKIRGVQSMLRRSGPSGHNAWGNHISRTADPAHLSVCDLPSPLLLDLPLIFFPLLHFQFSWSSYSYKMVIMLSVCVSMSVGVEQIQERPVKVKHDARCVTGKVQGQTKTQRGGILMYCYKNIT